MTINFVRFWLSGDSASQANGKRIAEGKKELEKIEKIKEFRIKIADEVIKYVCHLWKLQCFEVKSLDQHIDNTQPNIFN